jgi:hypothetical protein
MESIKYLCKYASPQNNTELPILWPNFFQIIMNSNMKPKIMNFKMNIPQQCFAASKVSLQFNYWIKFHESKRDKQHPNIMGSNQIQDNKNSNNCKW